VREKRPDLVLMDVRLAGAVDGVQAAWAIRQHHDIPVIYLTAHTDEETLRRARETEPLGYLVKPFSAPELRCAIEIALHKHEIIARLRERELWLATTLRSIGDAVVATDSKQVVNYLNPVAEALTGWKHDEALGQEIGAILSLLSEKTRFPVENPIGQALKEKTAVTLDPAAVLIARSGAETPIDDSAAPIIDSRGGVLGGVMVFRDVTEQRRTEVEIRKLNAELERRVLERTAELEAANRGLEAFSYSAAHDLRAPLRGIDGFSQALIKDHAANLGPEGLAHLNRVRQSAGLMRQLIDNLLHLSRVARAVPHKQTIDLSSLARLVAAGLRQADPEHEVEVIVADSVSVEGDARLLRIVLDNLLGNAWKFTAKVKQPRIEFGAFDKDGVRVWFVRDNGAGFDMRHAHKLFGAFQRLHATSEFQGAGIGLAIAQRIINRHGGRIWAEAEVGRGATFYFIV
jgi:PAS domain S-box-containing protein